MSPEIPTGPPQPLAAPPPVPPAAPGEPGAPPWQRLHPLTPWLRGWVVIVALAGYALSQAQNYYDKTEDMTTGDIEHLLLVALLVLLGVFLIATAWNYVWWRMTRFRITDDSVELTTGIIFRRHRSMRLDQLEAIDIVHPLVARIFKLVELKLESAGGADSYLSLMYLSAPKAEAVRSQILAQRALDQAPAPPNQEDNNPHLFRVPPSWTIRSYLRTLQPWVTLAALIASVVLSIWMGTWGGVFAIVPLFYGFFKVLWTRIVTEMGFTGYVYPEGIRLTHGLLTQINQTIPASRIQAIRLRQSLWWRGPDWWRIDLNVAGYGAPSNQGPSNNENRTLLIPVADPGMALTAVSSVMPRTPEIWSVIDYAMHGTDFRTGSGPGFVGSPPSARLFDPVAWRFQGYAHTPYALVIRTGRLTRTITVIPHDRIQAISIDAGVWQRRRGLATCTLDSTPGPITASIPHLSSPDAATLIDAEEPLITTSH